MHTSIRTEGGRPGTLSCSRQSEQPFPSASVAAPSRSVHPDSDRARIPSASVLNTSGAVGSGEKGGGDGGDASELCAETSRYNAMERRPRLWKNELGMLCATGDSQYTRSSTCGSDEVWW